MAEIAGLCDAATLDAGLAVPSAITVWQIVVFLFLAHDSSERWTRRIGSRESHPAARWRGTTENRDVWRWMQYPYGYLSHTRENRLGKTGLSFSYCLSHGEGPRTPRNPSLSSLVRLTDVQIHRLATRVLIADELDGFAEEMQARFPIRR